MLVTKTLASDLALLRLETDISVQGFAGQLKRFNKAGRGRLSFVLIGLVCFLQIFAFHVPCAIYFQNLQLGPLTASGLHVRIRDAK
jgi:hypothetical protein